MRKTLCVCITYGDGCELVDRHSDRFYKCPVIVRVAQKCLRKEGGESKRDGMRDRRSDGTKKRRKGENRWSENPRFRSVRPAIWNRKIKKQKEKKKKTN